MNRQRSVERLVIATGIASVVMQLLLLREFLCQFQGNEFTIALIFFSWLLLGGIGTRLAGAMRTITPKRLIVLALIFGIFSPFNILGIRLLRTLLFLPGSEVGFYPALTFIFLLSMPSALLIGALLPLSLAVLRLHLPKYPGARLYMLDNIGDASGGLLFSFLLILFLTPIQAAVIGNMPLVFTALAALWGNRPARSLFLVILFAALGLAVSPLLLERASLTPFEGDLVYYRESPYGRVTVEKIYDQYTLFLDDTPLYSSRNREQAEQIIHYPLSQLTEVKNILLISAEAGVMRELALHAPERIDYLEIDPRVTAAQFQFGFLEKTPGLSVIHRDGRDFLANTDRIYDAVILNLPEPDTFQINRFYTTEFFALIKKHLAPGGIFSFQVNGYDNYLARPQQEKISSLYKTAGNHFSHLLLLPGETVFFLCADRPLSADIPGLLAKKGIETQYISSLFHGNVTPRRLQYLKENILPDIGVNTDTTLFLMRIMFRQWFARFSTSPTPFYTVAAILLILYLIRSRREELVLFSTGFVTMGSETLLILVYQIFFGYIYEQIGLLVTVFLLGLLPGARLGEYLRKPEAKNIVRIRVLDGLITALLLGLALLVAMPTVLKPPLLFFLGFLISLLCGCQFPLALSLGGNDNPAAMRTFSADLMGAAYGTLATSLLLLPCFGIVNTAIALSAIKCASVLATMVRLHTATGNRLFGG